MNKNDELNLIMVMHILDVAFSFELYLRCTSTDVMSQSLGV